MRIDMVEGGGFAFVFEAEEKELGIEILLGLKTKDPESQEAIQHAIIEIQLDGLVATEDDTFH